TDARGGFGIAGGAEPVRGEELPRPRQSRIVQGVIAFILLTEPSHLQPDTPADFFLPCSLVTARLLRTENPVTQKVPRMCSSRPLTFLAGSSEASPRPWGARTSGPPAEPLPVRRPVLPATVAIRRPRT